MTLHLAQGLLEYISLLKLRIVALLLFVSVASAYLAANGDLSKLRWMLLVTTGAMAAGGAGALNHYFERDLDRVMARTSRRPLITGRISNPPAVLFTGIALIALAVGIALPQRPAQAFFLFAGAIIYVVFYTIWLKRRSPLNVIVGGAAGSCAILAGWSIVGNWLTPQPLLLALLVFLWTPPHFWSLAIMRLDDYSTARVPMLPVAVGPRSAALWGFLHVLLVVVVSLVLAYFGQLGFAYLLLASLAGLVYLLTGLLQIMRPDCATARLHFRLSVAYLTVVFAAVMVDVYLR